MRARLLIPLGVLIAISASAAFATADPAQSLRRQMTAARSELVQYFTQINSRSGIAASLEERIDSDSAGIEAQDKPAWISDADFLDYNTYLARLDASIVHQLASGQYHSLAGVRGADDTLFKSPADGTMQPVAAYVPASYDPQTPAPLVVLLHGRGDSENDMISSPWVRACAEAAGSIVIAPYARGDSQYVDPASADVYAALDLARKVFDVNPRRIYLAGHSMGGYGVFIVGPKHPDVWAAVLAASGGMVTEDTQAALQGLQRIPVYLVVGSNDPIVPPGYMKKNYDTLVASGIEAHYYEEPGGRHSIGTIKASFERVWRDMLARTNVRAPKSGGAIIPTISTSPPQRIP